MATATPAYVGERVAKLQDGGTPARGSGPRWMRVALVLLGVVVVLWAGAMISDVAGRASAIDQVSSVDTPVSTDLTTAITRLSEADQQATAIMLGGGATRDDDVQAVRANLDNAQQALIRVNSARPDLRDVVAQAQRDVNSYVTTVNGALDAQKLAPSPSGVANLRNASAQLRLALLPPLQVKLAELRAAETVPSLARAAAAPWSVVATGALALLVLLGVQWHLAVRSRRRLNAGLLVATLLLVVGTVWVTGAAMRTATAAGQDGAAGRIAASDRAVSSAIDAHQAYDDELVWFGEDGTGATGDAAGTRFAGALSRIDDRVASDDPVRDTVALWRAAHQEVDTALDSPDPRNLARSSILGTVPGCGTAFATLASTLDERVETGRTEVSEALQEASTPLGGMIALSASLGVLVLAAAAAGLLARMKDYR